MEEKRSSRGSSGCPQSYQAIPGWHFPEYSQVHAVEDVSFTVRTWAGGRSGR